MPLDELRKKEREFFRLSMELDLLFWKGRKYDMGEDYLNSISKAKELVDVALKAVLKLILAQDSSFGGKT